MGVTSLGGQKPAWLSGYLVSQAEFVQGLVEASSVWPQSLKSPELRVVPLVWGQVVTELMPQEKLQQFVGNLRTWSAQCEVDSNVRIPLAPPSDGGNPVSPKALYRRPGPLNTREFARCEALLVIGFGRKQVPAQTSHPAQ